MKLIVCMITALLLTGCSASAMGNRLDAAGEMLQNGAQAIVSTQAQAITREEAEAIALEHAGFSADQVTRLRTEYEIDNGIPRYEVQFSQGRWEYDYEINADTGEILSYDRDD